MNSVGVRQTPAVKATPTSLPPRGNRLRRDGLQGIICDMSTGPGSGGNVIAAFCSLFIPGLGQLVQGRILLAFVFFMGSGVLWFISFGTLGWVIHLWACVDAAVWKPSPAPSFLTRIRSFASFLIFIGIVVTIYFVAIYDTTVQTERRDVPGVGVIAEKSIVNFGKQQNRLIGVIIGTAIGISGLVLKFIPIRNDDA